MSSHPILYSFRRCPYAMRARLAIHLSGQEVELREIVLKDKPQSMLNYSPKGTVPVLILENPDTREEIVIDESLDIMNWALSKHDPQHYLSSSNQEAIDQLISLNDGEFKFYLDRYKYADRYPEQSEQEYREKGEAFLAQLDKRLESNNYLFGKNPCLADIAIFPFVRQFAHVNLKWFEQSSYTNLQRWLSEYKGSDIFLGIMKKYPAWKEGDEPTWF